MLTFWSFLFLLLHLLILFLNLIDIILIHLFNLFVWKQFLPFIVFTHLLNQFELFDLAFVDFVMIIILYFIHRFILIYHIFFPKFIIFFVLCLFLTISLLVFVIILFISFPFIIVFFQTYPCLKIITWENNIHLLGLSFQNFHQPYRCKILTIIVAVSLLLKIIIMLDVLFVHLKNYRVLNKRDISNHYLKYFCIIN